MGSFAAPLPGSTNQKRAKRVHSPMKLAPASKAKNADATTEPTLNTTSTGSSNVRPPRMIVPASRSSFRQILLSAENHPYKITKVRTEGIAKTIHLKLRVLQNTSEYPREENQSEST